MNLGWVYRNMNKAQESIAAYKKALELDPKQEQAALGLGWAYYYTKDYDEAIAAYKQAIQIDPKDAGADANLGIAWCYVFKRSPRQARGPTSTRRPRPGASVDAAQGQHRRAARRRRRPARS